VALTDAPATVAPVASTTVPRMLPEICWAAALKLTAITRQAQVRFLRIVIGDSA
jgi:hypothetical protein